MKKQELLKSLENTLEANKQENSERVEQITEQLTNELLLSLEKKLIGVPKGITRYILNKVVLTFIFTTLTMIMLGIWGYLAWEINTQNDKLVLLEKAQAQYKSLAPYINLGKIEILNENGKLYIATKEKGGSAYTVGDFTGVLMIEK